MNTSEIETLINNSNDIGSDPDMYHPKYGWLRVDGKITPEGFKFFEEQSKSLETNIEYLGE